MSSNTEDGDEGNKVIEQEQENEQGTIKTELNYQDWQGVDIMRSLCMRCGEDGETRLMLHKIPYFRELIIGMSL